jgi:hypothetical protein
LLTEALKQQRSTVADAIDGEKRRVGSADEPGEQFRAFLNPAIVIDKLSRCLPNEKAQPRDLMRSSSDIENRDAGEIEIVSHLLSGVRRSKLSLDSIELGTQGASFFFQQKASMLAFAIRRGQLFGALLRSLPSLHLAIEKLAQIGDQSIKRPDLRCAWRRGVTLLLDARR